MTEARIHTSEDIKSDLKINADICVVGSGAGGAVAAKELAEAGAKVVLLEEGPYRPSTMFNGNGLEMIKLLYRNYGFIASEKGTRIPIPLGRCIGGTTTINSGTALWPPPEIFNNWKKLHRVEEITHETMRPHFERVAKIIHIERVPDDLLGGSGRVVKAAVNTLGWKGENLLRNQDGCTGCGVCALGCPTEAKRSMLVTYVPLAVEAGARVQADARVEKIIVENKRVVGVEGVIMKDAKPKFSFRVNAPKVLIACGAILTPVLLLKNKLANSSGMLGKNLKIHPATGATAVFEELIEGWKGVPQSYLVEEFASEGITMEGAFTPPYLSAASLPFSGLRHKALMAKYKHCAMFGVMVSDESNGRVKPARRGFGPKISYELVEEDRKRLVKGLKATCEIFLAGGSKEIYPQLAFTEIIRSEADLKNAFNRHISADEMNLSAFHPMGTARIGASNKIGVVDGNLMCHDVENLYIVDAGVMPGSTRVNPQVSVMAFSTMAALKIAKKG